MPIEHAIFGPTGVSLPRIGQGTWNIERDDEKQVDAALRAGIDLGLTHIDTAELYGSGAAERILGRVIAGRRDEIYLVSKVLPSNGAHAGTLRACERSLERLGAKEALGVDEIQAVVDRGYFNNEEIKSCEESGITTFLPGEMMEAVSAIKLTPQKTISSAGVFAAICDKPKESPT